MLLLICALLLAAAAGSTPLMPMHGMACRCEGVGSSA
jgi:hypothetical protein